MATPPPPVAVDDPVPAAQLAETLRGGTLAAVPPLVLVGMLAFALRASRVGVGLAWLFAAAMVLAGVMALASAAARQGSNARTTGFTVGRPLAGRLVAAAVAAAFGMVGGAALFLACDPGVIGARPFVVAATAAMLANAFVIGPLGPVSLAFALPVVVGAGAGLVRGGDAWGPASVLLAAVLAMVVALDRRGKASTRAHRDRLRADEQGEVLATLLLDAEADAGEWVWETDAAGYVRRVSGAAAGTPSAALEGAWLPMVLRTGDAADDGAPREGPVLAAIAARAPFRNQVVAVRTGGRAIWWRLTGKPVHDAAGAFTGYRGLGADITASREAEARIAYLANYDSWTGLANRAAFQAHAARQCGDAATEGRCGALLYLDLDGFKSVNDTLGHAAGDMVLKAVARRLIAVAPPEAIVARLGGDEFAIWIDNAVPARTEDLADALIAAVAAPFDIEGSLVEVGASVGIALTPRHGTDPDDLLVRADLALYRAKAEGKGQWRLFVEAYELSLIERRKLEADLKLALARQEFELYYQPLVDLVSGEVVCFEALIRWRSPTRGFVSPADFIPAAEASGLIAAIGRWVLLTACKHAAGWPGEVLGTPHQASDRAPHVAVNISPRHFRSPDFMAEVRSALQLSGLRPGRLEVEVTEGVFLDASASAVDNLRALRKLGVRVALDDFGTGYSSLSYLINFPVDKIKIDRSFIKDFDREANRAVVDAILALARRLSIRVTAEGVETAEQAMALKLRRCDDIQGYLLGRPQPAGEVGTMLANVPAVFRRIIPEHLETPLGFALAMKKLAAPAP